MVKTILRFHLVCLVALLCAPTLHAKDLAAYRAGDVAEEDITASVPLDVIDADATAARKAAEALKTPAIFRSYPDATTNAVATAFLAAFAATQSNFLAAVQANYLQPTIDRKMVEQPDFAKFVAGFNDRSRSFPVSTELAGDWARGGGGAGERARLLDSLLRMMHRPIRPDALPDGFAVGETFRLAPVSGPDEPVTLAAAERDGKLITEANLTTLSRLRMLYRRDFPDNEQPLARALGAFLAANCVPDVKLTQQARDRDVRQLVVVAHYDAGDVLVRRGQTIDLKTMAALDQLRAKTLPDLLSQQLAAERERAQRAQEESQRQQEQTRLAQAQAQHEQEQARLDREQAKTEREQASRMHDQALSAQAQALKIRGRNEWLAAALAGVSVLMLVALGWLARQRKRVALMQARARSVALERVDKKDVVLQNHLAPYLVQILKEAVVQGLAEQRSELLQAQQRAATEIAELVHRLDQVQVPMQERLRIYEARIAELEKELAVRSEENRELLKLKIEMLRRQLEAEKEHDQMAFN